MYFLGPSRLSSRRKQLGITCAIFLMVSVASGHFSEQMCHYPRAYVFWTTFQSCFPTLSSKLRHDLFNGHGLNTIVLWLVTMWSSRRLYKFYDGSSSRHPFLLILTQLLKWFTWHDMTWSYSWTWPISKGKCVWYVVFDWLFKLDTLPHSQIVREGRMELTPSQARVRKRRDRPSFFLVISLCLVVFAIRSTTKQVAAGHTKTHGASASAKKEGGELFVVHTTPSSSLEKILDTTNVPEDEETTRRVYRASSSSSSTASPSNEGNNDFTSTTSEPPQNRTTTTTEPPPEGIITNNF